MAVSLQVRASAELELRRRQEQDKTTVVGLVSAAGKLTRTIANKTGEWLECNDTPQMYLAEKMERALVSNKRYIVIIGGRGSGKSVAGVDICAIDAKKGHKIYCLREYQSSIESSVYSLVAEEISRLKLNNFTVLGTSINYNSEPAFKFTGIARNTDSIKSAHGFKRFLIEEAQFISKKSLETLTPTARQKAKPGLPDVKHNDINNSQDNVSLMFIGNLGSAEDPFSKRFIVPFQSDLDTQGWYEDDLHTIVIINYSDNPWFLASGGEQDRLYAYNNFDRSLYDHIWLGNYNDSIEGSIIRAEWFDACIDAHIKLGIKPTGAKIAAHDPSDTGPDSKGYAMRHGIVFLDVQEKTDGNANDGGHWAAGLANNAIVDYFTWDADGMGCVLPEQMSRDFLGKHTRLEQFKGSETPDRPDSIYIPVNGASIKNQLLVKDAVKNKRAQYYADLRDRIYRTYLAVEKGEYHDPDKLISFSSEIALLSKLRSELCRMPIKPNGTGKFEMYTKLEMKTKFKFPSPNLADAVMMTMRFTPEQTQNFVMPTPVKAMGVRGC